MLGLLCWLNSSLQLSCTKNVAAILLTGNEVDIKVKLHSTVLGVLLYYSIFSRLSYSPVHTVRSLAEILMKDPPTSLCHFATGLIFWKINAYFEAGAITLVLVSVKLSLPLGLFIGSSPCSFKITVEPDSGHSFFIHSFCIFFLRLLQKDENYDLSNFFRRGDWGSGELFVVNQTF